MKIVPLSELRARESCHELDVGIIQGWLVGSDLRAEASPLRPTHDEKIEMLLFGMAPFP